MLSIGHVLVFLSNYHGMRETIVVNFSFNPGKLHVEVSWVLSSFHIPPVYYFFQSTNGTSSSYRSPTHNICTSFFEGKKE